MFLWVLAGTQLEDSSGYESLGDPSSAREDLGVISPLQDDFDTFSPISDLNLSPEPRSLLQLFREKRDALLGGRLLPELILEVEVTLYNNFVSQLEREMADFKEKERGLSEKWHWSTQKALERQRQVKELKTSLQKISRKLVEARAKFRQLRQTIQRWQNNVVFSRSRLEEMRRENDKLQK